MSLREEVAAYFSILEPAREKRADEIINKILDAAVESIFNHDKYDAYMWNGAEIKEAINKLRGE